jgi:hypothetical protein
MGVFILKYGLRDEGGHPMSSSLKIWQLRVDFRDATKSWSGGLK